MILEIQAGSRRVTVEVDAASAIPKVKVDGKELACDWVRHAKGHYSLVLDGRVHDFLIECGPGGCLVVGRDGSYSLKVADRRLPLPQHEVEEGRAGLQKLTAEMPGKVVRILVSPGETVAFDQGLLVLEAMKMQNEIRSPKSGVVREIGVAAGATVGTGQYLLSLE